MFTIKHRRADGEHVFEAFDVKHFTGVSGPVLIITIPNHSDPENPKEIIPDQNGVVYVMNSSGKTISVYNLFTRAGEGPVPSYSTFQTVYGNPKTQKVHFVTWKQQDDCCYDVNDVILDDSDPRAIEHKKAFPQIYGNQTCATDRPDS